MFAVQEAVGEQLHGELPLVILVPKRNVGGVQLLQQRPPSVLRDRRQVVLIDNHGLLRGPFDLDEPIPDGGGVGGSQDDVVEVPHILLLDLDSVVLRSRRNQPNGSAPRHQVLEVVTTAANA